MDYVALAGLMFYIAGVFSIICFNSRLVGFLSGMLGVCLFALAMQVSANQDFDLDHKAFTQFCTTNHDYDECEQVWNMVINSRS